MAISASRVSALDDIPECGLTAEAVASLKGFCEGLAEGWPEDFKKAFGEPSSVHRLRSRHMAGAYQVLDYYGE